MSQSLAKRGPLRDGRAKNWFWCENAIFEMDLSKHALLTYLFLCRKAGDTGSCWPSIQAIADATHCGRSTVAEAITELEVAGLVTRASTSTYDGDKGPNVYTLFNPDGGVRPQDYLVRQADGGSPAGNHEEDLLKKTTTPLIPQDSFEIFWTAYPKKKAKQDALRAWSKMVKAGKMPDLDVLLRALEAQKQSLAWLKDAGEFVPHAATWLNGARWSDDVAPAPTGRQESPAPQRPRSIDIPDDGKRIAPDGSVYYKTGRAS